MHWYSLNHTQVLTRDRSHLLQKFLHTNGNVDSSYDTNDGKITIITKFFLLLKLNFIWSFTILKSGWV